MNTIHTKDQSVKDIATKCFPDYNGRKFKVNITEFPKNMHSYWSDGSRSYFVVYRLSTGDKVSVPENGTPFVPSCENKVFPCPDIAVVEHKIFCGKDMGITIHIHPDNAAKMLPEPVELSADEKTVLKYTGSLKSSYAGIKDYRFYEANRSTGITKEAWETAKASCISKGLLDKRGAITCDGRNANS